MKFKNLYNEIAFQQNFKEDDVISYNDREWRIIKFLNDKTVSIQDIMSGGIFDVDISSLQDAELIDEIDNSNLTPMELTETTVVSKFLKYHLSNRLPLSDSIFRTYSESYFELLEEVRSLYKENKIKLCKLDTELVESDLGKTDTYEGRTVYLDAPIEEEEDLFMEAEYKGKKVSLNKPFRTNGGPKKYAVYVKNKNGNVIKVSFGDPNLKGNWNDKAAQRSFVARHKCSQKNDKTKAGYWSCRIHKMLGNRGTGRYW